MKSLSCPNGQCSLSGKSAVGHIIRYGFYTTKVGKASSLPVPDLWEDVLLNMRDTLLSTATPSRHL